MKKRKSLLDILLVALPAVAVLLSALPVCVRMRFGNPEGADYIHYYSGFSMMPAGYGNWGPMLTGILSAVLTLRGILHVSRKDKEKNFRGVGGMALTALALSLVSVYFGSMTVCGWAISALLLVLTVVSYLRVDKESI